MSEVDMLKSIEPKSDQMNAEDFMPPGRDGARTFTIRAVRGGSEEQPIWVDVDEHPQPFKPSKTVRRIMVAAWGLDSKAYIGQRMTLYCDPDVKWAGQKTGGIRVSHMSGLRKTLELALTETKGRRTPVRIEPLPDLPRPAAPRPPTMPELVAAFDAARITDPAQRLAYCSRVAGRSLASARDMTTAEAVKVMAELATDRQPATAPVPAGDELDDIPAPAPGETAVERVQRLAAEAAAASPPEPTDDELAEAYEREQAERTENDRG